MKFFLPNIIVPPGVEIHVDVTYDDQNEDFFVNGVEFAESKLIVTSLAVIDPKGLLTELFSSKVESFPDPIINNSPTIDHRPATPVNVRFTTTFLTKGSRVALRVKNPTSEDIRIEGFLKGYRILSILPFDLQTKAKLLQMFDECLIIAQSIKQNFLKGTRY